MARGAMIVGTDSVLRRMNIEVMRIRRRTAGGLLMAGILVKGLSMERTPVKTSKLVQSTYMILRSGPTGPGVEIGLTAAYAIFVHEIDKNYNKGQWKFLESALRDSHRQIINMIAMSATR